MCSCPGGLRCEIAVNLVQIARMPKPSDAVCEVIVHPRHPFRQRGYRLDKAQKSQSERRKVKLHIRIVDWSGVEFVGDVIHNQPL